MLTMIPFRKSTYFIVVSFAIVFLFLTSFSLNVVMAQSCPGTDYDCQIAEIQREIDALTPAHEQNKKELSDLGAQIKSIKAKIVGISNQLDGVESDIVLREEDLAYAGEIFNQKANNHYRLIRLYDPLLPFLSAEDALEVFREINFRSRAIDDNRQTMEGYVDDLIELKNDKEELERNQLGLASLQKQLDERADFLAGEVEEVESY